MRFAAFNVSDYEKEAFVRVQKELGLDLDIIDQELAETDVDLSVYDGVSSQGIHKISNAVIDRLSKCKVIAFRTIGYDYVDMDYVNKKGIAITNASYQPENVADFTVMLILMALRKAKISICKAMVNDFSLQDMCGGELRSRKVGIIGTGKIGRTVIRDLSGFGCEIFCNDIYENDEVKKHATYTSLDYIFRNCDIISLHMNLTRENIHMIDGKAINKMKEGVILINTSRGQLMDIDALIEGVESMKIGALGIDTVEGEEGLAHVDFGGHVNGLPNKRKIMYLKQFPNVTFTQHVAFFTKEAVYSMVKCSLLSLKSLEEASPLQYKVN